MSAPPTTTADPPMRNVYIAGLPPSFDDAQLLDLICSRCCDRGALDSIKCVMDPRTRMCRGYGFVLFSDAQLAQQAVQILDGLAVPAAPTSATSNERVIHHLQVRPAHLSAQPTKHDITTRNAAHIGAQAQQGLRDSGSSTRGTPTSIGGSQSPLLASQSVTSIAATPAGGVPPPPSYQQTCTKSTVPQLLSPMGSGSSVLSTSVFSPQLHHPPYQQQPMYLTQVPPGASVIGMGSSHSNNASISTIGLPKDGATSQQQQQLNNSMSTLTVVPTTASTTTHQQVANNNNNNNSTSNCVSENNTSPSSAAAAGGGGGQQSGNASNTKPHSTTAPPLNRSGGGSADDGLTLSALDATWNRSSMETNGTWNQSSNNFASSHSQLASPQQPSNVGLSMFERQQLGASRNDANNSPQPFLADSLFTSVAENPLFSPQTVASAPPTVGGKSTSALTSFPTTSNPNAIHHQQFSFQGLQFAPHQQQHAQTHVSSGGGGPLGLSFSTLAPPSTSFCTAVHPSPGCSLSNVFEQISFLKGNPPQQQQQQQQQQQLFPQMQQGCMMDNGHQAGYHQSGSTVTTPSPSLQQQQQQQLMHVVNYDPSSHMQQQDQQQHMMATPHMQQMHPQQQAHHHASGGSAGGQNFLPSASHPSFFGSMMTPTVGQALLHTHQHPQHLQGQPPLGNGQSLVFVQQQPQQQLQHHQGGGYQHPLPAQHQSSPMQYQMAHHAAVLHHQQQHHHNSGGPASGAYVSVPVGGPQPQLFPHANRNVPVQAQQSQFYHAAMPSGIPRYQQQ